jgi:hypothetical protein
VPLAVSHGLCFQSFRRFDFQAESLPPGRHNPMAAGLQAPM